MTALDHHGRPAPRRGSRLDGWSDGYTADTVYPDQFIRELCPTWFSMISVLNGQPPLDLADKGVWLDVACGTGLAACTVAASHPDVEVWGVDYNPAHVERARALAKAAGLTNATFVEADFATVARDRSVGPAEADVVVVNGVYSWVSPANQRHIVDIVSQRLRPGGLAHLMYETAGGWTSMTPVAEALRLLVDADGRRGDLAFHDAAAAVVALAASGAAYFPMGSRETVQMQGWADLDGEGAAHEYLGAHFAPLDAADVHDLVATAKCSFVGGLDPLDHHPHYSAPSAFADLLGARRERSSVEMLRDLVLQTSVRTDLFRRGRAAPTRFERQEWLRQLEIRGLGRPLTAEPIELPAMKASLDPAFHQPLVDALAAGPLTADAVLGIHPSWTLADATTALALLVAGGYAAPAVPGGPLPGAVDACRRLNRVLGRERRLGRPHGSAVAPATGAMVAVDLVEALALDALGEGAEPEVDGLSARVIDALAVLELTVREDQSLVHDPEQARAIVHRRVSDLLARRPALGLLGVT